MEEGEAYAIETFASTGMGMIQENGEASHFAVIPNHFATLRMQNSRKLLNHLNKTSLAGTRRRRIVCSQWE